MVNSEKVAVVFAVGIAVAALGAGDVDDSEMAPDAPPAPAAVPLEVLFTLDEDAFAAPPAPGFTVPFDVVTADMDLDGDADLLVNWHDLARLELFENDGGRFHLLNPAGDDRSGLFENPGLANLYAPPDEVLPRVGGAGRPGVWVWHEPDRRGDWHFWPGG